VLLGLWFGLKGFGLGTGLGVGTGFGLGESGSAETDAAADPQQAADLDGVEVSADLGEAAASGSRSVSSEAGGQAPATISVLVTGEGYQLLRDPNADVGKLPPPLSRHFQPATLEDVVAGAQAAQGNSSGVRVWIYRHKSSIVGLHGTLVHTLQDAGIPSGGMHVVSGFVD
jgi:hypothetical protein